MTSRHILVAGLALLALLQPLQAAAYLSPEEVLFQDSFLNNFTPPPSARTADARVAAQQQLSLQQRQAAQDAFFAAQHPVSSAPAHDAAGASSSSNADLQSVLNSLQQTLQGIQGTPTTESALRTQRLLNRIAANQTQQDQTLHSGAPLTQSGPATVGIMTLLGAAILWTIKRANKRATIAVEM